MSDTNNNNLGTKLCNIKEDTLTMWGKFSKMIAAVLSPIFTFLSPYFKPLNDKYLSATLPIRNWHQKLSDSSPFLGLSTKWVYKIFRYLFLFLLLLIFLSILGVFGHMPSKTELKNIENSNTTEIYSVDSVLIGKFYIENRTEIGLESISPYVITALLGVEDKRFFEHSGIDLRSWFRVLKGLSSSSSLGGGSTLSQQLAKNLYPRKNYYVPGLSILLNKIKENIISIKLESIYDKEQLLALYLNTVPFGGDRFGINVASKYFYNKKAKDLNPAESATLIGMLKATTALDPTRNPNNSKKRRNFVLSRMVQNTDFTFNDPSLATVSSLVANGKITQADYDKIKDKPVGAKKNAGDDTNDGKGAYFKEYLRVTAVPNILKKLIKEDGSKYNLYRDGLKIYTSVDSRLQSYAEEAVQKHMGTLQSKFNKHWKNYKGEEKAWGDDKWLEEQKIKSDRYQKMKEAKSSDEEINTSFNTPVNMTIFSWKNGGGDTDTLMTPLDSIKHYFLMLNVGFMAMDHSNGQVKAWVGGTNFKYFKYDHILSKRQVGSTFKPIVYAAAVRDSVKPCQYFKNEQVTILDWTPRNSDEKYGGWATMYGGITYSINTIAAKLIQKVGIQKTLDMAKAMGVTSDLPREFGISLGAADIMLYDMMKVYGTIANKGIRPEPVTILKIKDRSGKVIYDYKAELAKNVNLGPHVQAMSEDEAAIMTRMMQAVIDQGTGHKFRASGAVGEYAGKTGTTQNQSDGWFMVFNPYLVTGTWVGGPSPAVRFRDMDLGQGSSMALPVASEFWKRLRNDNYFRKYTDTKFKENATAINQVGCPFRLYINPDTLEMLMSDTILKDSIVKNGYRGLKEMVKAKYGSNTVTEGDEPLDGEEAIEGVPMSNTIRKDEDAKLAEDKKKLDLKTAENKKKIDAKLAEDKKKLDTKAIEDKRKLGSLNAEERKRIDAKLAEDKKKLDAKAVADRKKADAKTLEDKKKLEAKIGDDKKKIDAVKDASKPSPEKTINTPNSNTPPKPAAKKTDSKTIGTAAPKPASSPAKPTYGLVKKDTTKVGSTAKKTIAKAQTKAISKPLDSNVKSTSEKAGSN